MQPFTTFLQEVVGLEPVTSWSQGNSFTAVPRLPITSLLCLRGENAQHCCVVSLECTYLAVKYQQAEEVRRSSDIADCVSMSSANWMMAKLNYTAIGLAVKDLQP